MRELVEVKEKVAPCFPPKYDVFDKYFCTYKKILSDQLESYFEDMNNLIAEKPDSLLQIN